MSAGRRATLSVAATLVVLAAGGGGAGWRRAAPGTPAANGRAAAAPAGAAAARDRGPGWVAVENRRPGTASWRISRLGARTAIEGWADHASATTGQRVRLYVSTTAPSFKVQAYRMGWYRGRGARLVWRSPRVVGRRQPPPILTPGTNMVATHWHPSLTITVGVDWPAGDYLLKLVAANGQRYLPLTVRDDTSHAALLVQNAVTTWLA
jgi:hypothetical protein